MEITARRPPVGPSFCAQTGYNSIMAIRTTGDEQGKKPGEALDPIQAAADYGIDITQLRDNLALSVAERLRRHHIALNTVERLGKAKRACPANPSIWQTSCVVWFSWETPPFGELPHR